MVKVVCTSCWVFLCGAAASPGGAERLADAPTGSVWVEPAVPRGDVVPAELSVRFAPAGRDGLVGSRPEEPPDDAMWGETACHPHESGSWWCEVAAGSLDLRFLAPGFASASRGGVTVEPGASIDLGRLTMVHGASLLGRVALPPGGALAAGRVELALAPDSVDPADPAVREQERFASIREDGVFQFWELDPGFYRVSARARGWATAERTSIQVVAGAETELSRPLAMLRPASLLLCLQPADPPGFRRPGDTWIPVLHSEGGEARPPAPGCLAEPGCYGWSDLQPGRHRLAIEDGRGSLWYEKQVELEAGDSELDRELPLVPVQGTVTRDGSPVRARLIFQRVLPAKGDRLAGERTIVHYSSPQGRFDGALPAEGPWWVKVAVGTDGAEQPLGPVTVQRPERGAAVIHLTLAETRLWGRVVDGRGQSVRSAQVEASLLSSPKVAGSGATGRAVTDHYGRFEFEGLVPGRYRVTASDGGGRARIEVEVEESVASPPVKLVLDQARL